MIRRRSIVLVVALMMLSTVMAIGPAAALSPGTVEVSGKGWGHGIGMSQYGAYGMALEGRPYQEILGHYYTGSSVSTLSGSERLWVGITQQHTKIELTAWAIRDGAVPVSLTRGPDVLSIASGTSKETVGDRVVIEALPATETEPFGCTATRYPKGGDDPLPEDILARGDCGIDLVWDGDEDDPTSRIEITSTWTSTPPDGPGAACTLNDWNAVPSQDRPCSYSRGLMHVRLDDNTEAVNVSVEMSLDDYVLGISEMPYRWGTSAMEALKVQAIASRSYAWYFTQRRGAPEDRPWCSCHVVDTTSDQRYVGWGHGQSNWITAANSTASVVATHPHESGGAIAAYYSSSSGGRTEAIADVWNTSAVPYLVGADDHWAHSPTVSNPRTSWKAVMSTDEFATALGFDLVDSVVIREVFHSGSPSVIEVAGTKNGSEAVVEFDGNDLRSAFGLFSHYITSIVGDFSLKRLAGPDRYATAATISASSFAPGVPVVYVATGRDYPDALVAGAAAAHGGGPVLLVTESVVPTATKNELTRLKPAEIVIVGGPAAVQPGVETHLNTYAPVRRITGTNRITTSVNVSADAFDSADTVFVAVASNFPDTLSGSALAGLHGGPILLTSTGNVSGAVLQEIQRLGATEIVVLGGSGVVSDAAVAQLSSIAPTRRVAGADRYETSAAIAAEYAAPVDVVYVATGENFPDALAAAAPASHDGAPVLLVKTDILTTAVRQQLERLQPAEIVILGGSGAVSSSLESVLAPLAG